MCVGGGTERPAGFYCDLHFNFADVFYPICSHPTCVPGVGGEGLHFELQKTLPPPPECVQTCRDVPPGFLPSSFPPRTPLSLSWCVCLHQLSLSWEKVPREVCCIYRIEGSCLLLLTRNCNCVKAAAGTEQKIIIILSEPHHLNCGSPV